MHLELIRSLHWEMRKLFFGIFENLLSIVKHSKRKWRDFSQAELWPLPNTTSSIPIPSRICKHTCISISYADKQGRHVGQKTPPFSRVTPVLHPVLDIACLEVTDLPSGTWHNWVDFVSQRSVFFSTGTGIIIVARKMVGTTGNSSDTTILISVCVEK